MTLKELIKFKNDFSNIFKDYVDTLRKLSYKRYPNQLDEFAKLRGLKVETLKKYGVFYIGDGVELLHPNFISWLEPFGLIDNTNNKPIFNNRTIFTINDENDFPMALVGYQKESNNRYVYGSGSLFYERDNDFFGLADYYKALDKGLVLMVEGITDKMALEELAYTKKYELPIIANCGTGFSKVKQELLSRKGLSVLLISDRDKAGEKLCKEVSKLPRVGICRPPYIYNDIAEFITTKREDAEELLPLYLEAIVSNFKAGKRFVEYTIL